MKHLFAILISIFVPFACLAQQVVTNGDVRITFPSSDWQVTDPPPQLRQMFDRPDSPFKLVIHAVSGSSTKLRFYIAQYDYPPSLDNTDMVKVLTGYLEGLHHRFSRQTSEKIIERRDHVGAFPVEIIESPMPNGLFLEIRTIFCANRLYSLEINGPVDSKTAAEKCLDGVSIVGEKPVSASIINSVSQSNDERLKSMPPF